MPRRINRRQVLEYGWSAVSASLALSLLPAERAHAAPHFNDNPFKLGVASGDPTADGIVLWTRLAPEPLDPAALGQSAIPVRYWVARDETMRRVVQTGIALAVAELAHSVHVEVVGLLPGRDYFYRFSVRGEESAIGHFRTAPAQDVLATQLRFAVATCQDWASGYYTAYRDMAQQDLDLVLHLGDYTYLAGPRSAGWRAASSAPTHSGTLSGSRSWSLNWNTYPINRASIGTTPGTATRWHDSDCSTQWYRQS